MHRTLKILTGILATEVVVLTILVILLAVIQAQ